MKSFKTSTTFSRLKTLLAFAAVLLVAYILWGKIVLLAIALVLSIVLLVVAIHTHSNVERLIVTQVKKAIRTIVCVVFVLSLSIFAALVMYGDLQLMEYQVNSEAGILEFSHSSKKYATLQIGRFFDLGISLVSSSSQRFGFISGGMYMEMPTGTDSETKYDVYLIDFDNKLALYMASSTEPHLSANGGLQIKKTDDSIQEYCDKTLIRNVAAELGMDEGNLREIMLPVALQSVSPPATRGRLASTGIVCAVLFLTSASLGFVIPKLPYVKKRTKFGKLVSQREEFHVIERKINEQAKNPVFTDDSIIITQDYIIGKNSKGKYGFWYIDQLTGAKIEENVVFSDGDIQYCAYLFTCDDEFHFLTFDKKAVDDIITRIEHSC